jgi:hypothetical protein
MSYNSVPGEIAMKTAFLLASLFILSTGDSAQEKNELGLPELNVVRTAVLSPNYGCRSDAAFREGYAQTALFLSEYSRKRNAPDLLFNGACRSEDYFQAAAAGDDMSLVADLGIIPAGRSQQFTRVQRKAHSFF